MKRHDLATHVRVLGWIYVLSNAIIVLIGLTGFVFLTGIGVVSGDYASVGILGFIGGIGFLFLSALALPGMLAGYGLLKRTPWARVLAMVVAFLGLILFPIGTVVGVYTFWVMLQDQAADYFRAPNMLQVVQP